MKRKKEDLFPNEYVIPETDLTKTFKNQKAIIMPVQITIDKCRYDELVAKEEKLRLLEKAIKTLNSTYASEIKMLQEII